MSQKTTELVAKLTGDVDSALAELRKVKTELQTLGPAAQASTQRTGASVGELERYTEKAAKGVAAVTTAFYALEAQGSAKVLALGSAVGNFADILGPKGKVISGIAIVTTSIASLFMQAKEKAREAADSIEKDVRRMTRAGDLRSLSERQQLLFSGDSLFDDPNESKSASLKARGEAIRGGGIQGLRNELAPLEAQLRQLPPALSEGGRAIEEFNARQAKAQRRADELRAVLTALEAEYRLVSTGVKSATAAEVERETLAQQRKGDEKAADAAKRAAEQLAALQKQAGSLAETLGRAKPGEKAANDLREWVDAVEATGVPVRALQAELAGLNERLAGGDASAQKRIDEIRAKYGRVLDTLDKLTDLQEQFAGEESVTQAGKLIAVLQQLNEEDRQRLANWLKGAEASSKATTETKLQIAALELEIEALAKGAEAYDAYLRRKAQFDAEEAARAKARTEGRNATPEELQEARDAAGQLFDLSKQLERMRNAFANLGGDQLASLGDAGRNIAVIAGVAGPLLRGLGTLDGALQKRDSSGKVIEGKSVDLLAALSGRNGGTSQAAALAGSIQIVGAVAGIADALDLFGTRAKAKAEEMRRAAVEFTRALEDFAAAASPTTGATERINEARRQAVELAKQAAAASGGTFSFDASAITSTQLREVQRELFEAAATLGSRGGPLSELAARFGEVAATLDDVEEAARRQVLQNLEDLSVRRLQAAGLSEAAEAQRKELEQRRELAAASRDLTDVGQQYLAALQDIIAAEQKAAEAARARAQILQRLEDDDALLGGDSNQRLQRQRAAFSQLFADFAGLFDGLDLSTREGLEAAKATIRTLYEQFLSDGVIDETERPIVDFLKRFFGDIDNALSALPDVSDRISVALEAFNERIRLFGYTAAQQLGELKAIFGGQLGAAFDEILAGADLGTEEGRAQLRNKIDNALSEILADNEISEAERPLFDALNLILSVIGKAADEATAEAQRIADEAAKAEAERAAQRQATRARAANRVQLFDLDGADAIRETLGGFGEAFAALFREFDVETLQGVEGAKAVLRDVFASLEDLSDEQIMQQFGMTRDELLAAILDVDSGFDGLVSALLSVEEQTRATAQAGREFAESVNQDYLRAIGRGDDADRDAARQRRDARLKQAQDLNATQAVLDQIEAIYQADLNDIAKRATAAVTQAAVNTGALQGAVGGLVNTAASAAGASPRTRSNQVVSDFASLSEVTAQTMTGVLRQIEFNTGDRGALAAALRLPPTRPLSDLQFPPFPSAQQAATQSAAAAAGAGGGLVLQIQQITVAVAPGGYTPEEAGQRVAASLGNALRDVRADVRYLGSARRG